MKSFSVQILPNGELDGIIRPDMPFSPIGNLLGPPAWWDMGNSSPFSALLGYGDFQIELWVVESRVEVRRLSIKLWETLGEDAVPKQRELKLGKRARVDLGGYLPGSSVDCVRNKLISQGVDFSESRRNDFSDVKYVISIGSKAEILFFMMNDFLSLAELNFFSIRQGA